MFSKQTVYKQLSLETKFVERIFRAELSSVSNNIKFQILENVFAMFSCFLLTQ